MRVGTFNNSQIRKLTSDLIVLVRVFHYVGEPRDYPRMTADVWSSTIILPVNWAYNARSLIISDDLNDEQWPPVPLCSTTAELASVTFWLAELIMPVFRASPFLDV